MHGATELASKCYRSVYLIHFTPLQWYGVPYTLRDLCVLEGIIGHDMTVVPCREDGMRAYTRITTVAFTTNV